MLILVISFGILLLFSKKVLCYEYILVRNIRFHYPSQHRKINKKYISMND